MADRVGIPTTFHRVNFRSRLEAKWAAMFGQLGWEWEYEPFDLDGYIPDFVITNAKEPFLVEVKPALQLDGPEIREAKGKIGSSGWKGEALVVGATIFIDEDFGFGKKVCLGQLSQWCGPYIEATGDFEKESRSWSGGLVTSGCTPTRTGLWHDMMRYHCYLCGQYDGGGGPHDPLSDHLETELDHAWRTAGNLVQWTGTRK